MKYSIFILISIFVSHAASANFFSDRKIHHISVIADGNRRWAKEQGLTKRQGHEAGFLSVVPDITKKSFENGLNTLTIWYFSTENWNREKEEIDELMLIFPESLKKLLPIAKSLNARMIHIGRKDRLPSQFLETIKQVEEETRENSNHYLYIAIDYGGRDEVVRAAEKYKQSTSGAEFAFFLDTANASPFPNPDIVIRTSGENRLSGFTIWQAAYAELFFVKKYFPELTFEQIMSISDEFANERQRRFGR